MKNKVLMTVLLSAFSLGTMAETPTFNYVEAGLAAQEHDAVEGDFGGYKLAGSYELNSDFYLAGRFLTTSDRGLDLGLTTFGVGYQFAMSENTVLFTQLDFASVTFDRANSGEFEDKGYQVSFGVRSNMTESIEFKAAVKLLNAGEVDSTYGDFNPTYLEVGVSYMISAPFSLYADYERESDSNGYSFGVRYNF